MSKIFDSEIPTNSIVIVINKDDKLTYFASELKNVDLFLDASIKEIKMKYGKQ